MCNGDAKYAIRRRLNTSGKRCVCARVCIQERTVSLELHRPFSHLVLLVVHFSSFDTISPIPRCNQFDEIPINNLLLESEEKDCLVQIGILFHFFFFFSLQHSIILFK